MATPACGNSRPPGRGATAFPAFPYPPYDIQLDFMSALYSALDSGGVGLFESPTGTGKTLSLICASLQWLQDRRRREVVEAAGAGSSAAAQQQQQQQQQKPQQDVCGDDEDDAPDWMQDFGAEQERQRQQQLLEGQRQRVARAKVHLLRGDSRRAARRRGGARSAATGAVADDQEAEFLVEDWESDDAAAGGSGAGGGGRKRSPGTAGLGVGDSSDSEDGGDAGGALLGEDEELEVPRKRQIIFVSRTHSQLSQFVGELHRTPFADELSLVALGSRKALCINDAVLGLQSASLINERCLELQKPGSSSGNGGRKTAALAAAGGSEVVGPQQPQRKPKAGAGSASGRCPYLATGSQAAATTRDMILAQPIDIEELAKLGRRKSVCPYYSSRRALPEADIVLAPYSCLLVRETREALGLRLEGNVVIVDEAHNLVDAINSSHSAELSAAQAATAQRQLSAYFDRFQSRLAPGNCRHIQTLARCAQVLSGAASDGIQLGGPAIRGPGAGGAQGSTAAPGSSPGAVLTVNDFLLQTGLDNLNLFKLVSYVRESKAVYKIAGFWQGQQKREAAMAAAEAPAAAGGTSITEAAAAAGDGGGSAGTGALHALVGFLQALTSADADGRIIVQPPAAAGSSGNGSGATGSGAEPAAAARSGSNASGSGLLKFVLLNAAAHFGAVVSAAHAVVLASGTLAPLDSVLHLFPGLPPGRLHQFACGHVVGRERLLALAVGSGPSGAPLDFRHASRCSPATIDELGRLVLNTCQVVPGGMVVFFPSFSYADQVYARWKQSGLLRQLAARKRVFREPRLAGEVEACLKQYADSISAAAAAPSGTASGGKSGGSGSGSGSSVTGAIMLCVVGGKLAEGINFGDALGRCVVMVGLPYPNHSDPELQERMRFMDRAEAAATAPPLAAAAAVAAPAGPGATTGTAAARGSAGALAAAGAQAGAGSSAAGTVGGTAGGTAAGRRFYQDLCMKAVNQCVGRVIRHRGDYAAVLLVDARYAAAVDGRGQLTGPLAKLPAWIQQSLQVSKTFGEAFGRLARFSKAMAAAEAAAPAPAEKPS